MLRDNEWPSVLFRDSFMESSIPSVAIDISDIWSRVEYFKKQSIVNLDNFFNDDIFISEDIKKHVKIICVNKSAYELLQFDRNSYSKKIDLLIDYIKNHVINSLFDSKKYLSLTYKDVNESGKIFFWNLIVNFLYFKSTAVVVVSVFDVSGYKNSELILSGFVDKYYNLLKTIKDGLVVVDIESECILEANEKAFSMLMPSGKNIIGRKIVEFISEHEKDKFYNYYKNITLSDFTIDDSIELFVNSCDGNKIPMQISIVNALVGGSRVAQFVLHDMSNRFKMEEGRRLLATAVEQAAESVIITDINGNVQYVNPAFETISGYSLPEMLGKNPRILQSGKTPKYQYKLMWNEIAQGHVWRGVFINKKKNGEIYREEATITPVKDNQDQVISYVAVKRDITQQVLLENQVRQSQKMQAIGTLAGGIAHDFNNILTAIMGYAELSQSYCDKDSILFNNLNEIIRGADRAGQLVDQILQFSRQGEKEISSLRLSLIIEEVQKLIRASVPSTIKINCKIDDDLSVKADPTQMHQILLNLCTNAYQALHEHGGNVWIRLYKKFLSAKEGVVIGNLPSGYYACLEIRDNGIGIPPEYLQRIFEPYFTTKKLHEGTGLGLSVVHGIVNDHRGAVNVDSVPGQGSCFTVFLPEAEPAAG